jgi:ankyrin repeat protein
MVWVYLFSHACSWGNINDMVRFLDRGNIDLELRDKRGNTALQTAIYDDGRMGYGVIDTLLAYGANPFTMNDSGETTIHMAANYNNPDLVSRLIDLGVDENLACTRHGITPLQVAAINGCVDVVRLLINRGVDQSHKDPGMDCEICQRGGWTALDFSREMIQHHDLRGTEWDSRSEARYQTMEMLMVAEKKLAFAMGHNTRLGEGSILNGIDPDVLRVILDAVEIE